MRVNKSTSFLNRLANSWGNYWLFFIWFSVDLLKFLYFYHELSHKRQEWCGRWPVNFKIEEYYFYNDEMINGLIAQIFLENFHKIVSGSNLVYICYNNKVYFHVYIWFVQNFFTIIPNVRHIIVFKQKVCRFAYFLSFSSLCERQIEHDAWNFCTFENEETGKILSTLKLKISKTTEFHMIYFGLLPFETGAMFSNISLLYSCKCVCV